MNIFENDVVSVVSLPLFILKQYILFKK